MKALCLLSVFLCLHCCLSLPVRDGRPQVKEKLAKEIPGLDLDDYMKYWEEMASNDPSKSCPHSHRHTGNVIVCV